MEEISRKNGGNINKKEPKKISKNHNKKINERKQRNKFPKN